MHAAACVPLNARSCRQDAHQHAFSFAQKQMSWKSKKRLHLHAVLKAAFRGARWLQEKRFQLPGALGPNKQRSPAMRQGASREHNTCASFQARDRRASHAVWQSLQVKKSWHIPLLALQRKTVRIHNVRDIKKDYCAGLDISMMFFFETRRKQGAP